MATERDLSPRDAALSSPGPELRLLDRRAFVGFPPLAELWQKVKDAQVPIYV